MTHHLFTRPKKPRAKRPKTVQAAPVYQTNPADYEENPTQQQLNEMQRRMEQMQETIKSLTRQQAQGIDARATTTEEKEEALNKMLARDTAGAMDDIPLTETEKDALTRDVERLPVDKAPRVLEIIQESMELSGFQEDDIEIEIDMLPTPTQRRLQRYVNECFPAKKQRGAFF